MKLKRCDKDDTKIFYHTLRLGGESRLRYEAASSRVYASPCRKPRLASGTKISTPIPRRLVQSTEQTQFEQERFEGVQTNGTDSTDATERFSRTISRVACTRDGRRGIDIHPTSNSVRKYLPAAGRIVVDQSPKHGARSRTSDGRPRDNFIATHGKSPNR